MSETSGCCAGSMAHEKRDIPSQATVVEVHGSRFLLEWLDVEVLAAAAALRPSEAAPRRA